MSTEIKRLTEEYIRNHLKEFRDSYTRGYYTEGDRKEREKLVENLKTYENEIVDLILKFHTSEQDDIDPEEEHYWETLYYGFLLGRNIPVEISRDLHADLYHSVFNGSFFDNLKPEME